MLRSDSVLEQDVKAEIACDFACKAAGIGVSVKNGVVRLTGTVSSSALKMAVYRAVQRVFGVDGIDERLEIAAPAEAVAAVGGSALSAG